LNTEIRVEETDSPAGRPGKRAGRRRLFLEDDGISVPGLSALTAVYIVTMLNGVFWRTSALAVPLTDVSAIAFHASLLIALISAHALALCLLMPRPLDGLVPAALILAAAVAAYVAERTGLRIRASTLSDLVRGDLLAGRWPDAAFFWKVGALGFVPAVALLRLRIGRRRLRREMIRRARFAALCLVCACAAFAAQQDRLTAFLCEQDTWTLLNPYAILAASVHFLPISRW
jgi:glucan phosphoethanolaminetransferase (alkaline phosphatase superfamily)